MARGRQAPGLSIEPQLVAELLLLGTATGFLAGLLGIGGGMVQVPFLSLVLEQRGAPHEQALKIAIATAMATIVFTSLVSVRAHHARGAVRWPIVRAMAPGIVAGALAAGAGIFALVNAALLGLVFALFVGYSATQMLIGRAPNASRQMPGAVAQAAVGGGNQAARSGFSVLYVRAARLFDELQVAHGDGSFARRLAQLAKLDLLVIDDFAISPMGPAERNDLLELLDDRIGSRSTLITSQLPVKAWHTYLNDPTLADAILDRIVHSSHKIELKGTKSLRDNDAAKEP